MSINNNMQQMIEVMSIVDQRALEKESIENLLPNGKGFQDTYNGIIKYYKDNGIEVDLLEIRQATCQVIADQFNMKSVEVKKDFYKWATLASKYSFYVNTLKLLLLAIVVAATLIIGATSFVNNSHKNKYENAIENLVTVDAYFKSNNIEVSDDTFNGIIHSKESEVKLNQTALVSYIDKYKTKSDYSNYKEVVALNSNLVNSFNSLTSTVNAAKLYTQFSINPIVKENPDEFKNQLIDFKSRVLNGTVTEKDINSFNKKIKDFSIIKQSKVAYASFINDSNIPTNDSAFMEVFNDLDFTAKDSINKADTSSLQEAMNKIKSLLEFYRTPLTYIVGNNVNEKAGYERTEANTGAKRYYLISQAVTPSGKIMKVNVKSIENNKYYNVSTFGIGVDRNTYNSVKADKQSNGVITNNKVAKKNADSMNINSTNSRMNVNGSYIVNW